MVAATDEAVPTKKYVTPNHNVRLKPDTLAMMRKRDIAKKEGKKSYKFLRNKALSLVRRDAIQRSLDRISREGEKGAWGIVNEATGKKKSHELPLLRSSETNSESADMLNDFYVEKVKTLRQSITSNCPPKNSSPNEGGFEFFCVGVHAVRKALNQLSPKTALGVDKVPITAYKAGWDNLTTPLVHLVNLVIRTGQWPQEWKHALITPGLKANKPPLEPSSYRPIAQLCAVSKLVERVLYNQLIDYVETQAVLPQQQHGYRKGRGTHTALAQMFANIARAMDKGSKVGLSAYDFSSAFDTIEAPTLESKLFWASSHTRKLVRDYLSNGVQTVVWNGQHSKTNKVLFGVRQGSVIGPLLFILLTSDLPKLVSDNVKPEAKTALNMYADDTSSMCASKSWEVTNRAMAQISENLSNYADNNSIFLNKGKTQTLRLGQKSSTSDDTLNILGVEVNRMGKFTQHHSSMLSSLKQRAGAIRRLATVMPRGKLLTEIARSLVVGKLQTNCWVTREARLDPSPPHTDDIKTQRVMSDLARSLLGLRRSDRYRISELADRASLPTVNELVVKGAALAAWRAENGGPLADLLEAHDDRTRNSAQNQRKPTSARCVAAVNMSTCWNSSEALRKAKSLSEAKKAAKRLANSVRHL